MNDVFRDVSKKDRNLFYIYENFKKQALNK